MNISRIQYLLFAVLFVPLGLTAQIPTPQCDCALNFSGDINTATLSNDCSSASIDDNEWCVLRIEGQGPVDATYFTDLTDVLVIIASKNVTATFAGTAFSTASTYFYFPDGGTNIKVETSEGKVTYSYSENEDSKINQFNDKLAQCESVCTLADPAQAFVAPVTLLSWTTRADGTHVVLDWATSDEEDNSHFTVLHSTDGSNFSVLGNVGGQGTTGQISTYSLRHTKPSAGVNYYRIDQYDYDGTKTELGVQSVRMDASAGQLLRPSPNPVASGQRMMVGEHVADNTEVQIVSPAGRLVGSYLVQGRSFRVPELTPGVYTLRLNGEAARFVVAR